MSMKTKELSPAQVRRLAPGTAILLRAEFTGIDINALARVTISNKASAPLCIRLSDVVAEILPEAAAPLSVAEPPIPSPDDLRAEEVLGKTSRSRRFQLKRRD